MTEEDRLRVLHQQGHIQGFRRGVWRGFVAGVVVGLVPLAVVGFARASERAKIARMEAARESRAITTAYIAPGEAFRCSEFFRVACAPGDE
jgi:hypothetical protein